MENSSLTCAKTDGSLQVNAEKDCKENRLPLMYYQGGKN
jgi:hypothetical protein